MNDDPIADLRWRLPRHWRTLDALRTVVRDDERWRWLELSCSLGAGGGDELSDVDVGIGYELAGADPDVAAATREMALAIGDPVDLLVHRLPGWADDARRVAAEYADGLQLDLVLMPAHTGRGLPDRAIALVDKDGDLEPGWVPNVREPPDQRTAREWLFLGWWALANARKYVKRASWFEAAESLGEARGHALRLYAAGRGIPYPSFGLVSLLDFPPYELPTQLAATYPDPSDPESVTAALRACGDVLGHAGALAAGRLGADLHVDLNVTKPPQEPAP